jgi:hypothetical protein
MSPTIEQFEAFFNGMMKRESVAPSTDQRLYQLANKYGVPSSLVRVIWFMWANNTRMLDKEQS